MWYVRDYVSLQQQFIFSLVFFFFLKKQKFQLKFTTTLRLIVPLNPPPPMNDSC